MKKEIMKKNLKKSIFPFIMTILTFIIGCVFLWLSKDDPLDLKFKSLLIGFFPSFLFLILFLICYFKCNTSKSKKGIKILTTILACCLLGYYFGAVYICAFEESLNPITNVKYYKSKMNGKLLKVFPEEIPDNVEKVSFYYEPGFLQGGTSYALYYIDKNMTADKFDQRYRSDAIWVGHIKEYNEKGGLLLGAFSYTPVYYKNEDDFIIYLIEGRCDDSGYCNHGEFLFASYNEKTNEVIFKSEKW